MAGKDILWRYAEEGWEDPPSQIVVVSLVSLWDQGLTSGVVTKWLEEMLGHRSRHYDDASPWFFGINSMEQTISVFFWGREDIALLFKLTWGGV